MKITMIGTGYVGLVSGACFSEMGSTVTCVDVDEKKIENLKQGILPIYEPGLEAMVQQNHKDGLLHFSTSLARAMEDSSLYFIAVGTPPREDGSADLQYVLSVAAEIGRNLADYAVIVDKSTVPVGTADKVRETIQAELDSRGVDIDFDVVSNPEFLKEGAALGDFLKPDRIIVGADTKKARTVMKRVYAPFSRNRDKIIFMSVRDAEMTKYTANSMLAAKISFMNEIANICECLGVDVENVRKGIGSDSRIGYSFIYPGCGYGGSCFPKDVKALIRSSLDCGVEPELLLAVEKRNSRQKEMLPSKILNRLGPDLSNCTIGVWGLAFKPGTDDMREASSVVLINRLVTAGAVIKAYDPVAMKEAETVLPAEYFTTGRVVLVDTPYEALKGVDALALVTEWKMFRQPDFKLMKQYMRNTLIFDGRNQYDPLEVRESGFEYFGIGR
ncbi:MAG: UDP-glucose/GDP-mannose dehydrogenase family protein [Thermodesulfobacteriota bacterium]|nr:UDP-glucose/GDP-mannose dehydrogenase family protein [Thermodesulfobacteriota bacterium]